MILFSYSLKDPSWSSYRSTSSIRNLGGATGAYLSDWMLFMFGASIKLLPFLLFFRGVGIVSYVDEFKIKIGHDRGLFLIVLSLALMVFIASLYESLFLLNRLTVSLPYHQGGLVGSTLAEYFGRYGGDLLQVILIGCYLYLLSLFLDFSWLKMAELIGYLLEYPFLKLHLLLNEFLNRLK